MCIKKLYIPESLYRLPKFEYKLRAYYTWYEDKEYKIGFSDIPIIYSYPINNKVMDDEDIEIVEDKPLILCNHIEVYLEDKKKNRIYVFMIPSGYRYDGASIPRLFWRLIGSKEDVRFQIPALIHDVLCENKNYVDNDRYFADKIFERNLFVAGVSPFNRWLMFHSVDNWQKFCGWGKAEEWNT